MQASAGAIPTNAVLLMDPASISALSVLGGSLVGGLTSLAST